MGLHLIQMYANMYSYIHNVTIHVLHECCFIYGCSRIYGHPWLYTWHVEILDQVYAYMYIYGFDIFSDVGCCCTFFTWTNILVYCPT